MAYHGFVKIAMDEFYSHNPNNLTGLVQRYWTMVEDDIAGKRKVFILNNRKESIALAQKSQKRITVKN